MHAFQTFSLFNGYVLITADTEPMPCFLIASEAYLRGDSPVALTALLKGSGLGEFWLTMRNSIGAFFRGIRYYAIATRAIPVFCGLLSVVAWKLVSELYRFVTSSTKTCVP